MTETEYKVSLLLQEAQNLLNSFKSFSNPESDAAIVLARDEEDVIGSLKGRIEPMAALLVYAMEKEPAFEQVLNLALATRRRMLEEE